MEQQHAPNKFKWIIIGVIAVLALWFVGSFISTYNQFKTLNVQANTQWGQVETAYERRFALIPQLVASTKGFLKQEQAIFDKITQARASYNQAKANKDVAGSVAAANQMEGFLGRLLVIVEDNPEIQSQAVVTNLMAQLEGTENRINTERGRFNEVVGNYNILINRFPSNIVAMIFSFKERELFKASEGAATAPTVNIVPE
ncbi:MAG: LemA family protein [bacterium]|nr:LemA family protein [bacterium]